jgi:hypothetical protein
MLKYLFLFFSLVAVINANTIVGPNWVLKFDWDGKDMSGGIEHANRVEIGNGGGVNRTIFYTLDLTDPSIEPHGDKGVQFPDGKEFIIPLSDIFASRTDGTYQLAARIIDWVGNVDPQTGGWSPPEIISYDSSHATTGTITIDLNINVNINTNGN